MASQGAVATFSVVVLKPWRKSGGALLVGGEDLAVGPLGGQGAVEPFDLAVLPGAVGLDELLPDAVPGAQLPQRVPVGPGVVGHQSLDVGDAVSGEVADGPLQERGA